jgi:hypothetical protein
VYLDIAVAKLIEADHSNNINEKNNLLQILRKNNHQSSILNSFIELDKFNFNHTFETIDDYLNNNENKISKIVEFIIQSILPPNIEAGLHINSLYLSENGLLSSQLPSHYKFDRALANILRVNSSLINKDNLIVPVYSNTIRIYLEFAVLEYRPSIHQIQSLEKINIKKYYVKDQIVDNIFDPLIEKLPIFKVYK